MGYESKLYIVEKQGWGEDERTYAEVIAMFDLCKYYFLSDKLRYKPKTNCYFYADDGDTQVLEDMYGQPLTEATIQDVIDILEEDVKNGEDYRRIFPLLSALKVFAEQEKQFTWGELAVLHYGY